MTDRWRIVRLLGRGGMGEVFEAEDTLHGRRVAIKRLPPGDGVSASALARFSREAGVASRLRHPHVVAIEEVGEENGRPFIVMEYMACGSLQQRVDQSGPLPWSDAVDAMIQACRGVAAAHAAGLVHRDLKPSNLLVADDGTIKVADFGLVSRGSDQSQTLTGSGEVVGTPAYMSPEQCQHDSVDELTDVYSLGATFFALLVGHPPFVRDAPLKVMFAHCSAPIPDASAENPDVPEECSTVARRAMAKAPSARFGSAAEFGDALADLLGKPVRKQPTRRRAILLGLSVGAAAGLGYLGWRQTTRASDDGSVLCEDGAASDLAFSSDGLQLAAAGPWADSAGLRVWDVSGPRPRKLDLPGEGCPVGRALSVCFPSPGTALQVGLVVADRGQVAQLRLDGQPRWWPAAVLPAGRVLRMAVHHPSGRLAALLDSNGGTIAVHDPRLPDPVRIVPSVGDGVTALAVSAPRENAVAWADAAGTIHVWDVDPAKERKTLPAGRTVKSLAYATGGGVLFAAGGRQLQGWPPDNRRLLVRDLDHEIHMIAEAGAGRPWLTVGGPLTLWESDGLRPVRQFAAPGEPITSIAIHPDGLRVAMAIGDKVVLRALNPDGGGS
ncbi:MAG: protein kinase [Gemmataceae bacterium]|nr:protein kinase [Gemmataceae bacterium]